MTESLVLSGRVAWVTGAGKGIGAGIAKSLAANGAKVAVSARSKGDLDRVVSEIQAAGGEAYAVTADVAIRSLVRSHALTRHPRTQVIVQL